MHQEIKATVIWLLLAFFLTFAGFWQAKVVVASDTAAKHRELPPPAKTKHAIRPPPQAFTGDVVQDYIARCEKGMTDQEIRWILEDFHNAGLDLDWKNPSVTLEELLRFRAAQYRWYHDALVDGLRLSPEQSRQVSENLAKLIEMEKQWVFEDRKSKSDSSAPSDQDERTLMDDLSALMTPFSDIPIASPLHPWKLCQLTPEQAKLTWERWFLAIEKGNLGDSFEELTKPSSGPAFHSDFQGPGYPIDESLPIRSGLPDLIFPLLARQKLIAENDPTDVFSQPSDPPGLSALENVRLLHPSQFKALLLFNPELLPILQSQLDTESR